MTLAELEAELRAILVARGFEVYMGRQPRS
jgi:hypothetical protein